MLFDFILFCLINYTNCAADNECQQDANEYYYVASQARLIFVWDVVENGLLGSLDIHDGNLIFRRATGVFCLRYYFRIWLGRNVVVGIFVAKFELYVLVFGTEADWLDVQINDSRIFKCYFLAAFYIVKKCERRVLTTNLLAFLAGCKVHIDILLLMNFKSERVLIACQAWISYFIPT